MMVKSSGTSRAVAGPARPARHRSIFWIVGGFVLVVVLASLTTGPSASTAEVPADRTQMHYLLEPPDGEPVFVENPGYVRESAPGERAYAAAVTRFKAPTRWSFVKSERYQYDVAEIDPRVMGFTGSDPPDLDDDEAREVLALMARTHDDQRISDLMLGASKNGRVARQVIYWPAAVSIAGRYGGLSLGTLMIGFGAWRLFRVRTRMRKGQCVVCGYPLLPTFTVCPECGGEVPLTNTPPTDGISAHSDGAVRDGADAPS